MAHKQSELDERMNRAATGGGGIVPNAHPELSGGPRLGNPIEQIGGAIKKGLDFIRNYDPNKHPINKTGNAKSPSMTHDK